ncbi:MAG TPA: Gfo/Idh/MocA family oxidoreductase [Anaerolineae bacterium]
MTRKLKRVAVIGTGMIANAAHIPAWKAIPDEVEIVGVADIRAEAAQETAHRYSIPKAYTDPQKMLNELAPDIVSVCTPNVYHKQWSIAALKAGADVLCEKPLTTTYADALEMFATAKSVGKMLYPSQSMRFMNHFVAAREMVTEGRLGEVYYAEVNSIRRRGIPKWGFFHMKQHNAGGPVCDLGVHTIDAVLWIMGCPKVKAVSGMTYAKLGHLDEGLVTSLADSGAPIGVFTPRPYDYHEFDVEDFASGFIRLENDITLAIKTSWAVNMSESFSLVVAGTTSGIQLPPLKQLTNQGRYQVEIAPKVMPEPAVPFSGHYGMVVNFVKALRGEEERVVKPEETLNVIRIIELFYKSSAEGRELQA